MAPLVVEIEPVLLSVVIVPLLPIPKAAGPPPTEIVPVLFSVDIFPEL